MATIAIVGAIIAGTAVSAYGMYQQGQAAEEQGKAEQNILNYNAQLKEREAEAERRRAIEEARRFEEQGRALLGEQVVQYARGGVLSTTGTPADVISQTERELESDKMTILKEGYLAESYRLSEAAGLRYQGRAAKISGQNVKRGAMLSMGGTLLTGVGSAGLAAYKLRQPAPGKATSPRTVFNRTSYQGLGSHTQFTP